MAAWPVDPHSCAGNLPKLAATLARSPSLRLPAPFATPQCLTDPFTGKNYSEIGYPGMQPPLVRVGGYWYGEEPSSKGELFRVVRQVG